MKTIAQLLDELNAMPDIAVFLLNQGCQCNGGMYRTQSCPVAVYVAREAGVPVSVNHESVINLFNSTVTPVPARVSDFINDVDNGLYPGLMYGIDPITNTTL